MLFKNAIRTLKKRYLQLLLLGVIIALSSFIYTVIDYSIEGIIVPAEKFFTETNQEDYAIGMFDALLPDDIRFIENNCGASFMGLDASEWPYTVSGVKNISDVCYYGILDNRIAKIKDVYPNLDLQVRESKSVFFTKDNNSYRVLFLKDMDRIDKSYMVSGVRPANDSQIAISEAFAKNNSLSIGDTFKVKDKDYTISGFVLFPDYNLAMFGKEFIIDNASQTFALVTDSAFEALDEQVSFEIGGVYLNGYTDALFKTNVIDTYSDHDNLSFISNVALTKNVLRSGGIYSDIYGGKAEGLFLSIIISSIGLMIVGIMVSRIIQSQRGAIGILKSMGYTNNQIAKPYIFLIAIMALPAILLGYYLGFLLAEPFKDMFLNFYLLPSNPITASTKTIIIAIILPFVFIVGLSYVVVNKLLNKSPVTLLNPEVDSKMNSFTKRITKFFKNMKITKKLQHLLLYRSFIKLIVYIFGMFFAAFLILLSFSMIGIFQRTLYDYYEETNFNYIGYCEVSGSCAIPAGAEGVIEIPDVSVNDFDLSLFGIKTDSYMIPLYDKSGNEITSDLNNGIIITEAAHLSYGFKVGDIVTIKVGSTSLTLPIVSIAELYTDQSIYIDISVISKALTDTDNYYNAVYSPTELNKDNYMAVLNVDVLIEQSSNMSNLFNMIIYITVGVSILIGLIIIYILTVMTIEDNFYNISLFKVLGYNEKEINKIILGGYNFYGILSFLIMIPISIILFKFMKQMIATMFDFQFPIKFIWWQGVLAIIIYLLIFKVGAMSAKKNLSKISLQEAMKMYEI